jgi:hypothetical protein
LPYLVLSKVVSNPSEHKRLELKITEKNNKNTQARRLTSLIMIYTSKILKKAEKEEPCAYYD